MNESELKRPLANTFTISTTHTFLTHYQQQQQQETSNTHTHTHSKMRMNNYIMQHYCNTCQKHVRTQHTHTHLLSLTRTHIHNKQTQHVVYFCFESMHAPRHCFKPRIHGAPCMHACMVRSVKTAVL